MSWDLPEPFVWETRAADAHLDVFGHVNNAVYVDWMQKCAWAHWADDGHDPEDLQGVSRGMAILRSEVDYLAHGRAGDRVGVAVWVTMCDGKLRAERRFQVRRLADGVTLARGLWKLACFDLASGRPARMVEPLIAHYRVKDQVRDALESQDKKAR